MTAFMPHYIFTDPHSMRCCTSPCASPCGSLFKLSLILLATPALLRFAFFLGAMLIDGLFVAAIVASVSMLVRTSCATGCPASWSRRRCARADNKDPATAAAAAATSEKEAGPRRRLDLSSVQLVSRDDGDEGVMTLVVAAPGIRAADLNVNVVDQYVHITGESAKGPETFCIDRRILVPQGGADMDAISATHSEGTLTLVIKRKVPKRVQVTDGAPARVAREAADVVHEPRAEARLDPSAAAAAMAEDGRELLTPVPVDDEWEEAEAPRASKKKLP